MAKKRKAKPTTVDAPAPPTQPAQPAQPAPERKATLPQSLPRPDLSLWMLAGVIGLMLCTMLRELIHWIALRIAGLSSARLLPTAVRFDNQQQFWTMVEARDFAGAAQIAYPAAVGWAELMVPVTAVAITWVAALLIRRADLRPWMAGLGLAAALRLFAPASYVVLVVLRYWQGRAPHRQPDLPEYGVELLLGIPAAFLFLVEAALTAPAVRIILLECDLATARVRAIALAAGLCFGVAVLAAIAG